MCRVGFASSSEPKDFENIIKVFGSYYSSGNKDGFGYAVTDGTKLEVIKTKESGAIFWMKNKDKKINGISSIFHVRSATTGKVTDENSHPFISEDGQWALIHNGVISSYEDAKKFLVEKGHKFKTDVDSEVLLHAWEQWGEDFIPELKKLKVYGMCRVMIMNTKGEIYAYVDSTFPYYKNKSNHKKLTLGFSDDDIMGYTDKEFKSNHIYKIYKGSILTQKDIGELARWSSGYRGDDFDNDKTASTGTGKSISSVEKDFYGVDGITLDELKALPGTLSCSCCRERDVNEYCQNINCEKNLMMGMGFYCVSYGKLNGGKALHEHMCIDHGREERVYRIKYPGSIHATEDITYMYWPGGENGDEEPTPSQINDRTSEKPEDKIEEKKDEKKEKKSDTKK